MDMTIRPEFAERYGLGGAIYLDAVALILRARFARSMDAPGMPQWVWMTDADLHRGCLKFLTIDQIRIARDRLVALGALVPGTKEDAMLDGTPIEGEPPARALWFRLGDEDQFLAVCRIYRKRTDSNPVKNPDWNSEAQSGKSPVLKREKPRIAPILSTPSETPSDIDARTAPVVLEAIPAKPTRTRKPAKPKETTAGSAVWDAYAFAYANRYGRPPVRNGKQNALCTQLAERLGADAPFVAAFYVTHGARFYVQALHPLGILVRDCEAMHTQWAAGHQVTEALAKKIDTASEGNAMVERAAEKWKRKLREGDAP